MCIKSIRGKGDKVRDMPRLPGIGKDNKSEAESQEGFEIMANVIWAEFGRGIMDEMGSVVFAAGRPDEFRKVCHLFCYYAFNIADVKVQHHETTQAFIRSLEFLAPKWQRPGSS